MDDRMLLELLQNDPDTGMQILMEQYAGLVYAVVKNKLGSSLFVSTDIEDCVADVFSSFYMNLSTYDPTLSRIKSYLCVLARNRAVDMLRLRGKQFGELSADANHSKRIDWEADLLSEDDTQAEGELRHAVFYAIKELGPPDTEILLRKYYLGQSSAEIAAALHKSVSTVDTRTHRAIHKLQKKFEKEKIRKFGGYAT